MSSSNIWLSGFLAVVSSISSIVLSIQRGVSHNKPLYLDTKRDPTDPFVDTHRLTRLICSTLILTALAFFHLIHQLQHQQNDFITTLSSLCATLSWLYVLSLTFMSTRYRLPDPWGWKLNVHLFSIYLAAFTVAIVTAFEQIIVGQSDMPWLLAFPYLLSVLLTMDLVYVTITVKQGSRFLDDQHGRIVCGENVSSIWETIFFSYATPIFTKISQKKGDFTDADLPILTMPYRAGYIFYDFCVANDDQKKSLFRRLLFANRASLIIQVVLAVVASLLYYLPTFLLNRMLQLLQDLSQGTVVEYVELKGTLLVIGIGLSIMTMGVANAQLFYYGKNQTKKKKKRQIKYMNA
jgi:hypothetical protein